MRTTSVLHCLIASILSLPSLSQSSTEKFVPKLEAGIIEVDGLDTEETWKDAIMLSLDYEISPRHAVETDQKTTAKVYHDGSSLYIYIKAFDSEPGRLRALKSERDLVYSNEDSITVLIDPMRSQRRAYRFQVNSQGTQADSIQSSLGEASPKWNASWSSAPCARVVVTPVQPKPQLL